MEIPTTPPSRMVFGIKNNSRAAAAIMVPIVKIAKFNIVCVTESFEENEKYIDIGVLIIVDRENLKKIIIGRQGSMLKEVGTKARLDIENLINKSVST